MEDMRIRLLVRTSVGLVLASALVVATLLFVRAFDSRTLPDLRVWHRIELESRQVLARTSVGGKVSERLIEGEWPRLVYSLSHLAIPFAPDDAWYGDGSSDSDQTFGLGTLTPRGEKQVLVVPAELLLRLRCNPFFEYQAQRLNELLANMGR